jgi:ABC-type nickel/cobalt efflux system permease component RcnA
MRRRQNRWFLAAFLASLVALATVEAHPIPRRNHDRTITVRLHRDNDQLRVRVEYRLEVDEFTVVYVDLPALDDKVDLKQLHSPSEFYEAFTRSYAPILAGNVLARIDNKPVTFRCTQRGYRLQDENDVPLGHLRCDFVFEATAKLSSTPERTFALKEGNYELEEGVINLSLVSDGSLKFLKKTEPDEVLKKRAAAELQPGDDARLRSVLATLVPAAAPSQEAQTEAAPVTTVPAEGEPANDKPSLLALLLDSGQGFWALMFLAAGFGAAHALTPGHGKTLVAAYLVGEHGTAGHALVLGLVTTLTHTGAVLALAAVLLVLFPHAVPRDVQTALGLGGGLLVAGLGFWLLLRRLSGGADHIHLGGHGHHHHHHSGADHYHDEHGHVHPLPMGDVGWWRLVVLGISGGIIPCWDAIVMLGFAISAQRLWLGLPLLLAFSTGLASVLIIIGLAVVYLKGFASSRWGDSRLIRALPVLSAVLVTTMGLWLCYETVHAPTPAPADMVRAAP